MLRNLILTAGCYLIDHTFIGRIPSVRAPIKPKFVVFTVSDETLGAIEYGEFPTLKAAFDELLEQERICDPDSYWWVEESGTNNVYDSDSYFDTQFEAAMKRLGQDELNDVPDADNICSICNEPLINGECPVCYY